MTKRCTHRRAASSLSTTSNYTFVLSSSNINVERMTPLLHHLVVSSFAAAADLRGKQVASTVVRGFEARKGRRGGRDGAGAGSRFNESAAHQPCGGLTKKPHKKTTCINPPADELARLSVGGRGCRWYEADPLRSCLKHSRFSAPLATPVSGFSCSYGVYYI